MPEDQQGGAGGRTQAAAPKTAAAQTDASGTDRSRPGAARATTSGAAAKEPTAKKATAAKKATTAKKATAKKATAAKKAAPSRAAVKKAAADKPTATRKPAAPGPAAPRSSAKKTATLGSSRPSRRDIGNSARRDSDRRNSDRRNSDRRGAGAGGGRPPYDSATPLHVVPDPPETPDEDRAATPRAGDFTALVNLLVEALRRAGGLVGLEGDDLERRIAAALAFVRRRMTGDYEIDDFGFDQDFTEQVWLPLLRPLYKRWFRVEVRGIENIPRTGPALLVANHSGTLPVDGLMTQVAVHDDHPQHRHVRTLGADLVFESPLVGEFSRKAGATLASNPDIERLFAARELVAVFPEGFKGVGKPFAERYKLQRFGRGGFVAAALRAQVPIIPCSIVGAEEILPMIGNLKGLARLLGFPYFPVTPFFPLFGIAGLIPLPSKWIIEFGEPVELQGYGPAAADDPMVVFDLTDQVRETIQQTLHSLLLQRRSVFF